MRSATDCCASMPTASASITRSQSLTPPMRPTVSTLSATNSASPRQRHGSRLASLLVVALRENEPSERNFRATFDSAHKWASARRRRERHVRSSDLLFGSCRRIFWRYCNRYFLQVLLAATKQRPSHRRPLVEVSCERMTALDIEPDRSVPGHEWAGLPQTGPPRRRTKSAELGGERPLAGSVLLATSRAPGRRDRRPR